jgi:hypothetical protein
MTHILFKHLTLDYRLISVCKSTSARRKGRAKSRRQFHGPWTCLYPSQEPQRPRLAPPAPDYPRLRGNQSSTPQARYLLQDVLVFCPTRESPERLLYTLYSSIRMLPLSPIASHTIPAK